MNPNKQELTNISQWAEIARHILKGAKDKGASQAEITASYSEGFTTNVRLGEIETLEYHRDKGITITVYFGQKMGASSTNDLSVNSLHSAVNAACSIARATGEDECNGLADATLMAKNNPDLDLYHPWNITVEAAAEIARECEMSGQSSNKYITNSEGASITKDHSFYLYANSHDFIKHCFSSSHTLQCTLVAEDKQTGSRERDYEYSLSRDPAMLLTPDFIGREAAQKTAARLNARKLSTRKTPVIFAPRAACGILGHFISAVRGSNLYRKSSFLLNKLEHQIFPSFIEISENPHIPKAMGSTPFDSEGVQTQPRVFVENGILKSYILNSYSARKLGLQTTGNADGVHNLQITPNQQDLSLSDLLRKMHTGFLVTEVMGQGVNIVTGDYSRGAAGFWVENGEIQYPVSEVTIAGNLKDLFSGLAGVGNDRDYRSTIISGSLLFENMMIAGE